MPKKMSLKQIEANRRNAQKSTGPRTSAGRAVAKLNAVKHGILSKEVLVRGRNLNESAREFTALHQRFGEALQPVGPVEEMLVDQIVTTHWRLRRALTAEAGEIALSVDEGQWHRKSRRNKYTILLLELEDDPFLAMHDSSFGNLFMRNQLRKVRATVEAEGELTAAALQSVVFRGKPYGLTKRLEEWRLKAPPPPEGLASAECRAQQKEKILAFVDTELRTIAWREEKCERREEAEEAARQAAAVLPGLPVLDKIMRYETKLERQLSRAMAQLERVQRMRRGETLPAPLTVEVSERV